MENSIPKELIERINELAKKKKTEGLTPKEAQEQQKLRQKYLKMFRKNFRSHVEMLQIYNDEGQEVTPEKVKEIQRKRGLRDD